MTSAVRRLAKLGLAIGLAAAAPASAGQIAGFVTRQLTPIPAPAAQTPPPPAPAPTPVQNPVQNPNAPPQAPELRIDADFHTQVVNHFAQDANERIVVTASDDKTIRVWAANDGSPLATLRVPIAPGQEGAIYAVALSPDGRTLFAGGYTGATWDQAFAIYLFDLTTGRMKGRLPDLPAPINDLAFSPDGRSLAIAMGNGGGMRLVSATDGSLIASDVNFRQRLTSVTFDVHGRLYVTGFDGEVRAYGPDGRRIAQRTPIPGGQPYSVAVSPDGKTVAVGYADRPAVALLNAPDLAPRSTLNTDPLGHVEPPGAGLHAVAWQADGALIAAGSLIRNGRIVVRHWGRGGTGRPADWAGPTDTVLQIRATRDGGALLASYDPALMRLDRNGQVVFWKKSPAIAMRDLQDRPIRLSQDGMAVRLQTVAMPSPWTVDLSQRHVGPPISTRALTPIAAPVPDEVVADGPQPEVSDWRNSTTPRIAGARLALAANEQSRSYAISRSGTTVLIGTDYRLRVYDRTGRELNALELPGIVWGVGISGDGRTAVAALGDGTLRWFGLGRDGALTPLVTLFMAADGRRWVSWTQAGFFDYADTGGEGMVGVLLNRGRNETPDWYSFAQVYRRFYAPDAVQAALHGRPGTTNLGANGGGTAPGPGLDGVRQTVAQTPPPTVELRAACWLGRSGRQCQPLAASSVTRSLTPVAASSLETVDVTVPAEAESLTVQFGLRGETGTSSAVDIFINGRNGGRAVRDVSGDGRATVEQTVAISSGPNRIQLRAYDRSQQTYGESRIIDVVRSKPASQSVDGKPRLFILAVGINDYSKALPHLDFAVPDARSVAQAIRAHVPGSYAETKMFELYDEKASANAVLQAMAQIASQATSNDTVLIYLSGHGATFDQRYYFITQNVPTVEQATTTALSEGALVNGLAAIKSNNTMLFLDTCHAGAFSLDAASKLAHETGRYILAGAASVEEALDSYDNRNGVFATAILRGLAGQAVTGKDQVNNFDLGLFVTPLVKVLAHERHHDQSARFKIDADDAQPFPIVALADGKP